MASFRAREIENRGKWKGKGKDNGKGIRVAEVFARPSPSLSPSPTLSVNAHTTVPYIQIQQLWTTFIPSQIERNFYNTSSNDAKLQHS